MGMDSIFKKINEKFKRKTRNSLTVIYASQGYGAMLEGGFISVVFCEILFS